MTPQFNVKAELHTLTKLLGIVYKQGTDLKYVAAGGACLRFEQSEPLLRFTIFCVQSTDSSSFTQPMHLHTTVPDFVRAMR